MKTATTFFAKYFCSKRLHALKVKVIRFRFNNLHVVPTVINLYFLMVVTQLFWIFGYFG